MKGKLWIVGILLLVIITLYLVNRHPLPPTHEVCEELWDKVSQCRNEADNNEDKITVLQRCGQELMEEVRKEYGLTDAQVDILNEQCAI